MVHGIQDLEYLEPLDAYELFSGSWNDDNQTNLEFNAVTNGVTMSEDGFVENARQLISIAPSGSASITVLIKEKK